MDPSLQQLADALGVATAYEDWRRRPVEVPERTVRRVLQGLGVDVDRPEQALRDADERRWRRLVAPTVVATQGERTSVDIFAPDIGELIVELWLEGGEPRTLAGVGPAG